MVQTFRHLEMIRALAEHRHFGRAATALGVSQPALTRSLKYVEEDLGVPLFDREGVTPTPFGTILLAHGERILWEFAEMMRELALARGLDIGELRIVAGPYAADLAVQRAIGVLSARHPGLSVRLGIVDWTKAYDDVAAGVADIAVADLSEAATHTELLVEPIAAPLMGFYCSRQHPLAAMAAPTLSDLLNYPWVGPTTPARIGDALPRQEGEFGSFDRQRQRFLPRIMVETFPVMRQIIAEGLCIGAATPLQVRAEVEKGTLVRLPIATPWLRLNYGFILRRGRTPSPAAEAFMAIVRTIEQENARAGG